MNFRFWLPLAVLLISFSALAVEPNEMLSDPVLEARARAISQDLRCMVCQGESIDTSQAIFAHDVRLVIRAKLQVGASDKDVTEYLRSRYGDTILLKPPFEPRMLVLWLAPLIALMIGGFIVRENYRKRPAA